VTGIAAGRRHRSFVNRQISWHDWRLVSGDGTRFAYRVGNLSPQPYYANYVQPILMLDAMLATATFWNVTVVPSLRVNELPVPAAAAPITELAAALL